MARRRNTANGGDLGGGAPKRRGRPPKEKPEQTNVESYDIDAYRQFLDRIDRNSSDLNEIQADRRELLKGESGRGLNRVADSFVRSLRAKVRNDKLTLRDAQVIIDSVNVLWDWTGLPLDLASEQRGRVDEDATPPAI